MNSVRTDYDRLVTYFSENKSGKPFEKTSAKEKNSENKSIASGDGAAKKSSAKMSREDINKLISNNSNSGSKSKNNASDKSEFYSWLKEENKRSKESFILGKYYSGKRLNHNELKYIAKNRPDMAGQIAADMYSRVALWRRMKNAKSKTEVTMCCFSAISSSYNSKSGDGSARVNSMVETRNQYMRTREYAKKASTDYEARKRAKAKKNKRKLNAKV